MRASSPAVPTLIAAFTLAACGGGDSTISLRGDFAASDPAPTQVVAVEAQREAEVAAGVFSLAELTAGPATLLLLRGDDTVGTMLLGNLPAGAEVAMRGVRVDEATGRAFPASLEAVGAEMVTVNGVRMAPHASLPRRVDAPGVVLAVSDAADALLLRPEDGDLPDLRVIVDPATETVTPDGDPVSIDDLAPGDSVRVEGATHAGMVLASRLVVPRSLALSESASSDEAAPGDGDSGDARSGSGDDFGGGGSRASASDGGGSAARSVAAAPAVRRAPIVRERPGRGNDREKRNDREKGRGNDRDQERGRGNGNGKGGGKKN